MTKAAILVLAGTASTEGRITNALQTAKEFDEHNDEYEGHPSVRSLTAEGYEIITF